MAQHKLMMSLAMAALIVGCGSGIKYTHNWDPAANFAAYRTYGWMPEAGSRSANEQLWEGRLKAAVDRQMSLKGLQQGSNPDVLVTWEAATEGKVSVSTHGSMYGTGYRGRYGGFATGSSHTTVNEWDEGTLIIDIIDVKSERLVYRGSAQAKVNENRSPEDAEARLNEAVAKILEEFRGTGS